MIAGLVCAGPAGAQTIMRPEPALDSARAGVRAVLLVFRDSLTAIDGAAGRLQRDFRHASAASLVSRARVMRVACTAAARTLPPTRSAVLGLKLTKPARLQRRGELIRAMDQLKQALDRCEVDFAAMSREGQGETVRGYGNDRADRVQSVLRRYEKALSAFTGVMGIRLPPPGTPPRPSVG
jgi:hypothetical protein